LLVFSEDDHEKAAVVADTDDSLLIFEKEHSEAISSVEPEIEYSRPVTSLNATVNDSMDDTVPDYVNSKVRHFRHAFYRFMLVISPAYKLCN
jgi:hypothetical protein